MIERPRQRLGFGVSGPLGQAWFSEAKMRALIEKALAGGIAHFDTGPFYFDAERRLGAALAAASRPPVFISTKTGTRRKGRRLIKDFSERAIRADVDQSLRRLGRDRLDLLYLHGPTPEQIAETKPVLDALRCELKVGAIGVCGEADQLRRAIDLGFDAIMGAYNLIDRRHEEVFAAAKEKGVFTVAVAPFAQGLFDPDFFRLPKSLSDLWSIARAAFRGRYRRDEIVAAREAISGLGTARAALGFVLANPDIDIVMTTTTKAAHLDQSLAARELEGPDYVALKSLCLDRRGTRS